jgi:acetyl/propionyl-CoA carboxylase alpha subunit
MGIATVAVYSEADANAQHVREADEAVLIGPPPPAESYLRSDRLSEAARLFPPGSARSGILIVDEMHRRHGASSD